MPSAKKVMQVPIPQVNDNEGSADSLLPGLPYIALMSRFYSYLHTAIQLLATYKGEEPFASFLKKFFSNQKKYGSRDRKQISHLCYCYFRLGKACPGVADEERLLTALFLCSGEPNEILAGLRPEWNEKAGSSNEEKFSMFNIQCSISSVFPWELELSKGIDHKLFSRSFFIQPDLFLRLRPGREEKVQQKLKDAGLTYTSITDDCISLPNGSKIETVIELDKEAVVQDYSSQRVGDFFIGQTETVRPGANRVWDCCAASGGKSLMLYDLNPAVDLTVSDIRASILINLKKRFERAGIKKYRSFVADLTHLPVTIPNSDLTAPDSRRAFGKPSAAEGLSTPDSPFDLIICDAPCTGSGTWSRTPEQLFYFNESRISEYAALQKKIVSNIIPYLRPGGHILYITCSVFKKENEEIIEFIRDQYGLEIKRTEILKGYDLRADTMFAALLSRPV